MFYNSPNREITYGTEITLKVPEDTGLLVNLLGELKPSVKVIEIYREFDLPTRRNEMIGLLNNYGKIKYQEDWIAHIPKGKILEDPLIHLLLDLRKRHLEKKETIQADYITERLREMGIVILPRKDSTLIWNIDGQIK
jgi:hypothetical protein